MSDANSQHLSFACPKCQKKLRAPPNLAGHKLVCPKCSSPIRVPGVVETKSDDEDWLSLNDPNEIKSAVATPKKKELKDATVTQQATTKPISHKSASQPKKIDPDEFVLAPTESSDSKRLPNTSSSNTTTPKSVFDDDLPELMPVDDGPIEGALANPKLKTFESSKTSSKASSKPALALPEIPLPGFDLAHDPLAQLDGPALIEPMASVVEEEFSFHCKVCGSLLSSIRSRIGTKTSCPDCYSQLSVPSPTSKKKLADVTMDADVARVTFAPIDSLSANGTNNFSQKTKEILERAEQTLESEREEFLDGTFDTRRWMGLLFGFLRDPLVIAAAVGLGFITGFWLFAIAAFGTWIQLHGTQVVFARLAILGLFFIPIVGAICMCGIAILTMAANRASRVVEWPFGKLTESIGDCAMVMVSVMVSSIPGGMLGAVSSSLNADPMVSTAFVLLGIWGLTPILLLSMIDNNSIFGPYSKAVLNSFQSKTEAWGAMYMQSAMAWIALTLLMVITSMQSPAGDFILGFSLPVFCFFEINQYGVLAGRISQVTAMEFEGDFSDD